MKILFISHHREKSGWGISAREMISCLDAVGLDVVCRPILVGNSSAELSDRLIELENKSTEGCDICIQYLLPHFFIYNGNFKKNIGIFCTETDSLGVSGWENYINLMDECIVFSRDSQQACLKSGVDRPVYIINHPTRVEKFAEPRNTIDLGSDFKFLGVGEFQPRKNWGALIRAFHQTFHPSEPVSLVLKLNSPHKKGAELIREVENYINRIKFDMRLYPDNRTYKEEILITEYLSESQMLDLHYSCDSYVSTSHGEAINLGLLDAVGFGKSPVVTNTGGMKEIVLNTMGTLVSAQKSPVTGVHDSLPDLFTSYENWDSVDICEFGKAMRKVFSYGKLKYNPKNMYLYSYEYVGNCMKEIING